MKETNAVGMEVVEVSNRWKMIIFFLYTIMVVASVLMFTKWVLLIMFIPVAFSYNSLVNGQVWLMPMGGKKQ